MEVFKDYSKYYNLLYRDKDYNGEVEYVDGLIKKYNPQAKTILDLGCGTGRHDFLLVEKGYSVTGVDISETMLSEARNRASSVKFYEGDIRKIRLQEKFDVVIALFHVMSYQTENQDLMNAFQTAFEHLNKDGIFIFDFWYGPAVLTDRPSVRVKRLEDDEMRVVRIAEPFMYPDENVVDVNYEVIVENKKRGSFYKIKESHSMRYFFEPEMKFFLHQSGLQLINRAEWMSGKEMGAHTWYGCYISNIFWDS